MTTNSVTPKKSDVCVVCFNYTNTVLNKGHYFIPAKCFLFVAGIWKIKNLKSEKDEFKQKIQNNILR